MCGTGRPPAADLLSDHFSSIVMPYQIPRCPTSCGRAVASRLGARLVAAIVLGDISGSTLVASHLKSIVRLETCRAVDPRSATFCSRNDPRATHVPAAREQRWQIGTRVTLTASIVADMDVLGRDRKRAGPPPYLNAVPPSASLHPDVGVEERHAEHAFAAHRWEPLRQRAAGERHPPPGRIVDVDGECQP